MVVNAYHAQTISPALCKPFVVTVITLPHVSRVRQLCTMIFIPHLTNQETGAPQGLRVVNQGHLTTSTPQDLVSSFILTFFEK